MNYCLILTIIVCDTFYYYHVLQRGNWGVVNCSNRLTQRGNGRDGTQIQALLQGLCSQPLYQDASSKERRLGSPFEINKCSRNSHSSEGCEPGVSAFLRGILKSLGNFFKLPTPFLVTSHLLQSENPQCGQSLLAVQNVFSPSSIFGGKMRL